MIFQKPPEMCDRKGGPGAFMSPPAYKRMLTLNPHCTASIYLTVNTYLLCLLIISVICYLLRPITISVLTNSTALTIAE